MSTFVAIFVLVLYAILAWRHFRFALVLLAGLLPTYLVRYSIGPIPTTLLELLILTAFVVFLFRRPTTNNQLPLTDAWIPASLLLLAAASIGIVVAPNHLGAFGIWKAYFVEPMLVFLMMRTTFTKKDIEPVFIALTISGMIVSMFAIIQYLTGSFIPIPWDLERRVTSIFDFPNAVGLFLAPIVAINVLLYKNGPATGRPLHIASIALALLAIFFAKTEATFVAIPAGLFLTYFISSASKRKKIVASGIAVCLVLITLAIPAFRAKILLQDTSGQVRLSQWQETVIMLKDAPIFGTGLNGYKEALIPYHNATHYEIFQYPHNIFLNIWTELGLLGLVAFGWLAFLTIRAVYPTNVQLAAFAALATMTIHGLVDVPYFKNDLAVMVWILFAVISLSQNKANPTK